MNPVIVLSAFGFMVFMMGTAISAEPLPTTESSTESEHNKTNAEPTEGVVVPLPKEKIDEKLTSERVNHSRMLKTSTLGYEEWWYATTRRPPIYYKDFPGVSGVASWKEITTSNVDSRKSRKMKPPTSSGVSSASVQLASVAICSFTLCIYVITCLFPTDLPLVVKYLNTILQ